MLLTWRANCEAQLMTNLDAICRYIVKYLTKGEPVSSYLKTIRELACANSNEHDTTKRLIQTILMASIGSHDYSAQECGHHLLGLPMYFCSRTFVTINTSGLRTIDETGTLPNQLDIYKVCHGNLEACSLYHYVQRYVSEVLKAGATPHLRRKEVIVVVKPRISPTATKPAMRELYFQQQMILHVPWRNNPANLKGEFSTWEEAFKASNAVSPLIIDMHEEDLPKDEEEQEGVPPLETEPYHLATVGDDLPHAKSQDMWMEMNEDPLNEFLKGGQNIDSAYSGFVDDPTTDWTVCPEGISFPLA
jgi:hypothetical protein